MRFNCDIQFGDVAIRAICGLAIGDASMRLRLIVKHNSNYWCQIAAVTIVTGILNFFQTVWN